MKNPIEKIASFLNVRTVNFLIALLFALMSVFPDIMLRQEENFAGQQAPPEWNVGEMPPQGNPPNAVPQAPPDAKLEMPPNNDFQPPSQQNKEQPQKPNFGSRNTHILMDFLFFYVFALLLLFVNTEMLLRTPNAQEKPYRIPFRFAVVLIQSLLITALFVVFYSMIHPQQAAFSFNRLVLIKCMFVVVMAIGTVYISYLLHLRQQVVLENEKLISENTQSRYDVLATQMNPHFFFNSLNALSSLVRENQSEKSLGYIQKLSDLFRYAMNKKAESLATLRQEMSFLDSYRYLFEIRFEDKLSFDIQVDSVFLSHRLPRLSLQPLIENVIKHNEISSERPLKISVHTKDNFLVVSNPIQLKFGMVDSNEVGLDNLNNRFQLLLAKKIQIEDDGVRFTVKLPLAKPER